MTILHSAIAFHYYTTVLYVLCQSVCTPSELKMEVLNEVEVVGIYRSVYVCTYYVLTVVSHIEESHAVQDRLCIDISASGQKRLGTKSHVAYMVVLVRLSSAERSMNLPMGSEQSMYIDADALFLSPGNLKPTAGGYLISAMSSFMLPPY